ncbi:hypothetical protein [Streptomyces sp. NPDC048442]|uniref:hypothetical protein n=1 Tax=Streptomyces sp. NPDC048442 TaxID=3154823 RepID=UPI0034246A3F
MTDVLTWTIERRVQRAELLRKEPAELEVEVARLEELTSEYRRIMEIVTGADGPVMAKDVARALGRELTPGKVEPVRGQVRKLADRGWLARAGAGRNLPR